MIPICTLQTKTHGETVLFAGRYPKDGAVALALMSKDGEPLCTFTTNLKSYGHPLQDNEFHVCTWNNEAFVGPVMESGLFEDTGKRAPSGFVEAPVWRFKDETLVPPAIAKRKRSVQ